MQRIVLVLVFASLLLTTVVAAQEFPTIPRPTQEQLSRASAQIATLPSNGQECTGLNLLTNPSFEGEYHSYVPSTPTPDCPAGICTTAQMATGWKPFWRWHNDADPGYIYRMPEYKPAESIFTDPPRVRSGDRAQQYFTFWSTHQGGIYQQVSGITPGDTYCLSVWGHSWSTWDDNPYTPPDNHGMLEQKIGIDPTGGTDYTSGNIIWTSPVLQYDEYGLFRVEAQAVSDKMTVFFFSEPQWAAKHNDVYWDDAFFGNLVPPDPAEMTVSPLAQTFTTDTDNWLVTSAELDVTIANNYDNLSWDATILESSDFNHGLHREGNKLYININSLDLVAGTYQANIHIEAEDATIAGGSQTATVTLVVNRGKPVVVPAHTNLGYLAEQANPISIERSVNIALANLEESSWNASVDPTSDFTPSLSTTWGQHNDSLTLTTGSASLPIGTHQARIIITGNDDRFEQTATIEMTITVVEEIQSILLPITVK